VGPTGAGPRQKQSDRSCSKAMVYISIILRYSWRKTIMMLFEKQCMSILSGGSRAGPWPPKFQTDDHLKKSWELLSSWLSISTLAMIKFVACVIFWINRCTCVSLIYRYVNHFKNNSIQLLLLSLFYISIYLYLYFYLYFCSVRSVLINSKQKIGRKCTFLISKHMDQCVNSFIICFISVCSTY